MGKLTTGMSAYLTLYINDETIKKKDTLKSIFSHNM